MCDICHDSGKTNVCRKCRERFRSISVSDYEFHLCLGCDNCDNYGFPCIDCARYAFDGRLGNGYFLTDIPSEKSIEIMQNNPSTLSMIAIGDEHINRYVLCNVDPSDDTEESDNEIDSKEVEIDIEESRENKIDSNKLYCVLF